MIGATAVPAQAHGETAYRISGTVTGPVTKLNENELSTPRRPVHTDTPTQTTRGNLRLAYTGPDNAARMIQRSQSDSGCLTADHSHCCLTADSLLSLCCCVVCLRFIVVRFHRYGSSQQGSSTTARGSTCTNTRRALALLRFVFFLCELLAVWTDSDECSWGSHRLKNPTSEPVRQVLQLVHTTRKTEG